MMRDRYRWLIYVALAGLSWGTYVPLIAYGGVELGAKSGARLLAILCVGVAYFLIAVLVPLFYLLRLPFQDRPERSISGLIFSGLAGAAGAAGAMGVVFATQAAPTFKLYIAPLIFGLAPIINTLVSIVWHPQKGKPFKFGFEAPHPLLWVGIILVASGAAMVLYSKEVREKEEKEEAARAARAAKVETKATAPSEPPKEPSFMDALQEGFSGSNPWLLFVTIAGVSWGTYVPLIFYGGSELGGKPSSRLAAILCVGIAYFIMAIIIPGIILSTTEADKQPNWSSVTGLTFSGLAGAAGAIGAICVIFATKSAIESAKAAGRPPGTYKLFIAPLIFGVAPVINTLVGIVWQPVPGDTFHSHIKFPGWELVAGIVGVGLGAALVLYSKELGEARHAAASAGPKVAEQPKPVTGA